MLFSQLSCVSVAARGRFARFSVASVVKRIRLLVYGRIILLRSAILLSLIFLERLVSFNNGRYR